MTGAGGLQAWHITLFVTAGILVVELIVHLTLKLRADRSGDQRADADGPLRDRRLRTIGLGLLVVLTLVLAVAALGPSLADQLASVTAAVLAAVPAWLTYRSYLETVRLTEERRRAATLKIEEPSPPP